MIDRERHARSGEQVAQTVHLIVGQRVHRIDDDCRDPGRGVLIPQPQGAGDDGVKKTLRLAGAGAGRNERWMSRHDGPDGFLLMTVKMRVSCEPHNMLMQEPFLHSRSQADALRERAAQRHVRSGE